MTLRGAELGRHFTLLVFGGLAVIVALVYAPALNAYFISDDFQYLSYLFNNSPALLNWDKLDFWFIGGMDGYLYFRPAGHALVLLDYILWYLSPFGYHLTNVLLHLGASFLVYLLTVRLLQQRAAAAFTAALFAVLSVHAEAVSWVAARYDVLAGLYSFASVLFLVLYAQKGKPFYYVISLGASAMALASKETAIVLPAVLLLYDALYNLKQVGDAPRLLVRHVPYWTLLFARLYYFGHGYKGFQIVPEGIGYWVDLNLNSLLNPLQFDMTPEIRWLVLGAALLLLVMTRFRRSVVLALLWIAVTSVATITSGPSNRSFYIPSFGLTFLLGSLVAAWTANPERVRRWAWVGACVALLFGYGLALYQRNQVYYRAGEIAQAIPAQVIAAHPTLPADARLVFTGVPEFTPEGVLVYLSGFPGLLRTAYPGQNLQVYKLSKFPIWLDNLDRTFFFQVDHRRVVERTDLIDELRQLNACSGFSLPAVRWDWNTDEPGWEAWNDLSDLLVREAELTTRAVGSEPYMGSPPVDIPSLALGSVEIVMRVRADNPQPGAALYWRAAGQGDFSPGLSIAFPVTADGALHTYALDLAGSGQLFMGDRIVQFRLDPANGPAEIGIKSIQVTTHCSTVQGGHCACGQ